MTEVFGTTPDFFGSYETPPGFYISRGSFLYPPGGVTEKMKLSFQQKNLLPQLIAAAEDEKKNRWEDFEEFFPTFSNWEIGRVIKLVRSAKRRGIKLPVESWVGFFEEEIFYEYR
jgi:hypothetical protein